MPGLLVHKRAFVSTIVTALALSGVADITTNGGLTWHAA